MADKQTKAAVIVREFYDVGTGNVFAAGDSVDLDPGVFANYFAAGLVTDPKDGKPAPVAAA